MSMTAEQLTEGRRLRAMVPPAPWATVAGRLGCRRYTIQCALEPGYAEYMRTRERCRRAGLPKPKRRSPERQTINAFEIPRDVLLDRDRRLAMAPRSLTAALCGDPAPGRSAWDKRQPT